MVQKAGLSKGPVQKMSLVGLFGESDCVVEGDCESGLGVLVSVDHEMFDLFDDAAEDAFDSVVEALVCEFEALPESRVRAVAIEIWPWLVGSFKLYAAESLLHSVASIRLSPENAAAREAAFDATLDTADAALPTAKYTTPKSVAKRFAGRSFRSELRMKKAKKLAARGFSREKVVSARKRRARRDVRFVW